MDDYAIPGIAVGVLHKGDTFSRGFGVTNVDNPLPVTSETLFQIGSITKTFTGTAIMRLVELGKLELDATVRTYLPEFKVLDEAAAAQATIRHLLTHVGGWVGDYFHETGSGDDALQQYVASMAGLEQLAPVGKVFSYNNSGFAVAGRIIEVVTGQSYEAALEELVLKPLGLNSSFLFPGDVMTYRFVAGHRIGDEGAEVARPWPLPRAAYALGGIVCNVQDLLRYAQFHLGDGQTVDGVRLLSTEGMRQMQSPQVNVRENEYRGLSWMVADIEGVRQISHGGGTKGQISQLIIVPEHDFALIVFTNADHGSLATRDISRWVLKQTFDLDICDPIALTSTVEELVPYVGCYGRPYADVELGILAGKLVGQITYKLGFPTKDTPPQPAPPPASFALTGKDRLTITDGLMKGAVVDIIRKEDGSIGWLRHSNRIHVRQV